MKNKQQYQTKGRHLTGRYMKVFASVFIACHISDSSASVLMNSGITLTINSANGAIDSLKYQGVEYTKHGTFWADWGIQLGTDTSSFRVNTSNGLEQIPVATFTSGGSIIASGVYNVGGSSILVNRSYSLLSTNVVEITSSFTNLSASSVNFRYFDTYDPDQGIPSGMGFGTNLDVYGLNGSDVACSIGANGYAMILASESEFDVVSAGDLYLMTDGNALNSLFNSPVDSNGAFLDALMNSAYEFNLGIDESVQRKHYISLGETKAIAEEALAPEPSSAFLSVFGAALALVRRRK